MRSNLVIPLELFSARKYVLSIKFASSCFDINGTRQYEFLKRRNLNLGLCLRQPRAPLAAELGWSRFLWAALGLCWGRDKLFCTERVLWKAAGDTAGPKL